MYVAAHPDDDLLFMNPDIADSIAAGNRVVIVHLTAGDVRTDRLAKLPDAPDFTRYWTDRERGVLNAYSAMLLGADHALDAYAVDGVPDGWTARTIVVGDLAMPEYDLGAVSAVFLRISDFQLMNAWLDRPGTGGQQVEGQGALAPGATITDACAGEVCPLGTELASQIVSRDQLLDALGRLIAHFGVDSVSAQDATTPGLGGGLYWDTLGIPAFTGPSAGYTEYWDHVFGAAFTLAAAIRVQAVLARPLQIRLYRGYTLSQEPANLGAARAAAKTAVFRAYAMFDDRIVAHAERASDAALGGNYDLDAPGSWQFRELATRTLVGTIPLTGRLAVAGTCLGIAADQLAPVACDAAPAWQLTLQGQVELAGTASCVAIGATGVAELAACAPRTAASTLLLFGNGQLRTADARCLALGDAGFASVACGHEPLAPHATGEVIASQDFTLLFDLARQVSTTLRAIGAPTYDDTFRVVHGRICARQPDGLACEAPFAAPVVFDPETSDAAGWHPDAYGDTVAAVWDPASAAIVACARAPDGLHCGGKMAPEFSDGDGWAVRESYYGSLRYADLTSSGRLDACGRSERGLACVTGDWSELHVWTTSFSDAEGWDAPAYGEAISLGDLDGDGLVDACGRSAFGLECVVQRPRAGWNVLDDDAFWSFDEDRSTTGVAADFSDRDPAEPWAAGGYRSLQLIDVNRDGLADACGRGARGLYCAFSTGTAFERKRLVAPDALGGATLAWGDLDGDARLDACALAADGVWCASAY